MAYLSLACHSSRIPPRESQAKIEPLLPDLAAQTLRIQGDAQKPQSRHIDALSVILAHKD